jgi:hypothetical protein
MREFKKYKIKEIKRGRERKELHTGVLISP